MKRILKESTKLSTI